MAFLRPLEVCEQRHEFPAPSLPDRPGRPYLPPVRPGSRAGGEEPAKTPGPSNAAEKIRDPAQESENSRRWPHRSRTLSGICKVSIVEHVHRTRYILLVSD